MLLSIGGAGAAARPASSPAANDHRQAEVSISEVERVLAVRLNESAVSGGALALVSDEGIEARAVGSAGADREVTADTRFVIGSTSNALTALTVMQKGQWRRVLDPADALHRDLGGQHRGQPVDCPGTFLLPHR